MSVTQGQPTVKVKKADGSVVRMTLDELKAYKAVQGTDSSAQPSSSSALPQDLPEEYPSVVIPTSEEEQGVAQSSRADVVETLDADALPGAEAVEEVRAAENNMVEMLEADILPGAESIEPASDMPLAKNESVSLATTTPVADAFVDAAEAKEEEKKHVVSKMQSGKTTPPQAQQDMVQWEADDHKSLLEEPLNVDTSTHKGQMEYRKTKVDNIIAALPFTVPAEAQDRVRSIVLSRLKDVRNDDQVRAYVVRPIDRGGLGLTEEDAEAMVATIHGDTTVSAPVQQVNSEVVLPKETLSQHDAPSSRFQKRNEESHVPLRQSMGKKPVLHDIRPPIATQPPVQSVPTTSAHAQVKRTMGPVDEFLSIDMTAFRQLDANPEAAKDKLLQKAEVLKKDSYLLFMQAQHAWFQSPLYRQYQSVIGTALRNGSTIAATIEGLGGEITQEEFTSIVQFNDVLT